ncbi:MAG TPA: hypothetical protein VFH47_04080, partial [Candidatus Thermoplasmatota archaeon]|nr:hypothetical protein [Candidatus Thermoplasmatota archaeon]
MPAGLRFWAFLAAAALAVAGVQLGATLQLEQWLETSLDLADENAQRNTGNFVFATAILAAAGAAACVAALSRLPLRRRLRPAAAVAAGTYVLLVMAQTAMTTVLAVRPEGGQGQAQLAVNPFVAHAYATPSVLVPLLGLAAGAAALAAWGLVRLWRPSEPSLAGVHRLQLAATATAAPLCVVGKAEKRHEDARGGVRVGDEGVDGQLRLA